MTESDKGIIRLVIKLYFDQTLHDIRRICIILIAFMLLAGCKSAAELSETDISKQEAIEVALEIAASSRPEISGAQITPHNVTAQQMTLDQAVKTINENNQVPSGQDPHMTVWFVTMAGLWLGEMSAPDLAQTPDPVPYHHYAIIIDAKTGLELESSLSP